MPDYAINKTTLIIDNRGFDDQDMAYLCAISDLTRLDIYNDLANNGKKLTGATLSALAGLKKLEKLDLDGNAIPGSALKALLPLTNLRELRIGIGNPIHNDGMAALNQMPNL